MEYINVELPELPFAVEEALNKLRINVKFCGVNTRKIMVVSSLENEGKSFVAVQLWRMLAEAGFPTVLVDCDFRKSILKKRHNLKKIGHDREHASTDDYIGIDYYLSGQAEYEDIIYETNLEKGHFIPCSNALENPSPLLEDPRVEELLDRLAQDYRYVIIDTPPLDNVSDSVQLATLSDGAILVVRSGETSRRLVRRSMQQLERVNCSLLGTVLNRVKTGSRGYYRYYGRYGNYYSKSYYGGYYGEKE